jgi:hypothetical protein
MNHSPWTQQEVLTFLQQNITRARNRQSAWNNEITKEMAYRQGERQNWQCAITGERLEFSRGGTWWQNKWCNPQSCVIDRIDPNRGYYADNIQLVTHMANTWKSNFTPWELKLLCESYRKRPYYADITGDIAVDPAGDKPNPQLANNLFSRHFDYVT